MLWRLAAAQLASFSEGIIVVLIEAAYTAAAPNHPQELIINAQVFPMKRSMFSLHVLLAALFMTQPLFFGLVSPVRAQQDITYELGIAVDRARKVITGTAHITIPAGEKFSLLVDSVNITAALLQKGEAAPGIYAPITTSQLTIGREKVQQELLISYEKTIEGDSDNFIEEGGITLLDGWYPYPGSPVLFSLTATIPKNFRAIAESDHLQRISGPVADFSFSSPRRSLHFIAAPYAIDSLEVRPGLRVYTYFLPTEKELAGGYLEAARGFILRYEEMIGPYPYNHFAIVENLRPTGYGMATFTLLGRSVIRLPFIKNTSLGHEILHSWFGNGVEIDISQGNWAEGLTSYLADWLYRQDQGQGAVHRKKEILTYHSYVPENSTATLRSFRSPSHNQPLARKQRSIGYIRGALLFHELRQLLGDSSFFEALQNFYQRFQGRSASWTDIEEIFSNTSAKDLAAFFRQRLERGAVADIAIEAESVDPADNTLRFTVVQQTEEPFTFVLPMSVEDVAGSTTFRRTISSLRQEIELPLRLPPLSLTLDPEYDMLRRLETNELTAPLSLFLGVEPATLVIDPQREEPSALIDFATRHQWQVASAGTITTDEREAGNLILAGRNNPLLKSLFGSLAHPPTGATLESRRHPLDRERSILLVSFADARQLEMIIPKLRHYGGYTYLHFQDGTLVEKRFSPGTMGIRLDLAATPSGIASADVMRFDDILDSLARKDVVYVGERHTSMGDHQLQYMVIDGLHRRSADIAIALEMFPTSSQEALDRYTLADRELSERDFLKQSDYFKVWNFDYRYYRNIIDFAKKHRLPLVALNIDREIVSSIFKGGSPAALTEKQKAQLPAERDLSLPGYYQRLAAMHDLHMQGGHGRGQVSGFIQAQAVWDEIMAENIADFLREHPQTQVIVLAGTQHVRKDSGIPPRLQRRLEVRQSVLLGDDTASPLPADLADFVIFAADIPLPVAGRIGISLEEKQQNGDTFLEIAAISPQGNAAQAGLRKEDILISVNDYPVKTLEDVRIAMVGGGPGDVVTLAVKRNGDTAAATPQEFKVELYQPAD